jgi:predicted membrane protein
VKRFFATVLSLWFVFVAGAAAIALTIKRRRGSVGDEQSNEFDLVTIMEELKFSSRATAFRRGGWLAYFGGGRLDLSGAQLAPEGARLELRAVFGGGEIIVPRDCKVEIRTRGPGGVQDSTGDPAVLDARSLTIDAYCLLGGFQLLRGQHAATALSV